MPGPGWGAGENPLLSGLFGAFQTASAARQSTADLWTTLRVNAATWAWQAQGGGELPNMADLENTGRGILSAQGVGIRQVNAYRAIANQWRTAKSNLHQLDFTDQIGSKHIFTPPWAQTAQQGVPDRYRARVEWEITPIEGDTFTTWGSYEVDSPLTSLQDIFDQAGALVGKKPTSDIPVGATVSDVTDYELEQI